MSSQLPSCASSSSSIRFAPTEKLGPSADDDERRKILRRFAHAALQHLERVTADRVHLGVQRHGEHAVLEIDEAGARVGRDDALPIARAAKNLERGVRRARAARAERLCRRARLRPTARTVQAASRIPIAWRDRRRRSNARSPARPRPHSEGTEGEWLAETRRPDRCR